MTTESTTSKRGWMVALVVAILATVLTVTFVAVNAYQDASCNASAACIQERKVDEAHDVQCDAIDKANQEIANGERTGKGFAVPYFC